MNVQPIGRPSLRKGWGIEILSELDWMPVAATNTSKTFPSPSPTIRFRILYDGTPVFELQAAQCTLWHLGEGRTIHDFGRALDRLSDAEELLNAAKSYVNIPSDDYAMQRLIAAIEAMERPAPGVFR